jgi:hypothetical protein
MPLFFLLLHLDENGVCGERVFELNARATKMTAGGG